MYFINLHLSDFFLDTEQTAKLKTQSMKITFLNSIFTFTLSGLPSYISCQSHRFHYKYRCVCWKRNTYVHMAWESFFSLPLGASVEMRSKLLTFFTGQSVLWTFRAEMQFVHWYQALFQLRIPLKNKHYILFCRNIQGLHWLFPMWK